MTDLRAALLQAIEIAWTFDIDARTGEQGREMRGRMRQRLAALRQLAEAQPKPAAKLTIDTSDPETKAVWETAQRAKEEVASWPAWKRGEQPEPTSEDVERVARYLRVAYSDPHNEGWWLAAARAAIAAGLDPAKV